MRRVPRGISVYGIPLNRLDPKSRCSFTSGPILDTYASVFRSFGSLSIGVFQTLSAGKIGQLPILGPEAVFAYATESTASVAEPWAPRLYVGMLFHTSQAAATAI